MDRDDAEFNISDAISSKVTTYSTSAASQSYSTFNPNSARSASILVSWIARSGVDALERPGVIPGLVFGSATYTHMVNNQLLRTWVSRVSGIPDLDFHRPT